jgi:hypothetical protein
MTQTELNNFLETHSGNIEWQLVEDLDQPAAFLFRNVTLPWYREDDKRATMVTLKALESLDESGLMKEINRGLDIEQITRVTGYYGKVSHFNPGKVGELNDRHRVEVR